MRHPGHLFFILVFILPALASAQPAFETVERRSFQQTIHLDGIIEAVQQSTVSAQTSGTVQKLPYDVDDSVVAGDLIVQLEDSEQRSRLRQARAGLEEAEAALTDARQQFNRIESVHEQGLVSGQEFDQARNNLAAARARVASAKGSVSVAEEQLSYTRVEAPYDGILTERHVEVGESVSPGQPLLSGLSLEELRVVVDLPQKYAEMARAERQARVKLADGRVLETGEMTFYPYANPASHTFRLRMRLNEPNGSLFPGMLVKVSIPVASRESLWVPASSLIHRSELRAVYILDSNDQPRLRQVSTGIRDGESLEILAGVSEGERVVTDPSVLVGSERLNLPEAAEPGGEEGR
ncbi:efflux RND transporter periplasmic adaptor subunit [Marinobacter orientalis]|uniref:Efflux RND transporter periplasmic adaptor subunit n=1 Tax=Marinobacter orientalis TaxID=1928859 RepID=A0A7Y0RB27_9GAMM|nr:efflux RND transporter periplasmic adaptor subunit [Marinobacter orientalis]NMT63002.1 efflux RND transporter periplasmic adaptor subunit [Marinobacter orientalis]TGX51667.1 efflux RND transporter periplasmic adaptor subunit [Marinobacter orientalis]